jgi:uncharacterized protein (TIGR03437 family)
VTVTAPDATNNPLTFSVTFVVNGVRGAGNNANGDATVAPNTILNLYGTGLTCIGTSSGQVSIVIPQAGPIVAAATRDAGSHDASIHWMCNGVEIGSIDVPLATAAPALYTLSGNGTGQALMLNQDYTLNSPGNAAKRGSYVSFFGTGFGSLGLAGLDGLRRLTSTVTASVGGVAARVVYAGETPGFTQALQQIVVQIPDNATVGIAQPIVVTADGVATPYGVMFAIQ